MSQLRFDLARPPSFARDAFVVSSSNAAAAAAVDAWPGWIGGALALVGPEGSGKSHLATTWAARAGAAAVPAGRLTPGALPALVGRPVWIDDVDQGVADEPLFHLLNAAAAGRGDLLLTARRRPSAWASRLPDLRSRLNALPVAELGAPDDDLMRAIVARHLEAQGLRPLEDVVDYVVTRIERSAARAREAALALDAEMDARGRGLTKLLAREVLDKLQAAPDLFDEAGPAKRT